MAQKNRQITSIFYLRIFFLFFFSVFVALASQAVVAFYQQYRVDSFLQRAEFPEYKGKKPTFQADLKTLNSTTQVVSFLPENLLSEKNFDVDAAQKTIEYVDAISRNQEELVFDPFAQDGLVVRARLLPKTKAKVENIVVILSKDDPIPPALVRDMDKFPVFTQQYKDRKTFALTRKISGGFATFIYFSEPETWKYGIPTRDGRTLTPKQQLNTLFNIEIWKRSVNLVLLDESVIIENKEYVIFTTLESVWNTFGQLVVAKQENTPIPLMKTRLDNRILSQKRNRAYYPFDEIAEKIYKNAPQNPIIR